MLIKILKEAFLGSMSSILTVAKIVIPLMIIIEIIKELNLLDKICGIFKPLTKMLKLSETTILPLFSGLFFGIVYGAGLIIDAAEEGNISKKDMYLVIVFLGACHAIVEDTLVFVQIGANGWVIFFVRLISAFILTYILSIIFDKSNTAKRIIKEEIAG
ncbi:nucleoside recognition domain-containing protein [Thermobrachium celere]|uniref:Nucleoside binding-domain containing protein YvoD n=1 Tax=Thermobrachium celere DSM 8682 TaxID=941824 RepID=R7RQ78_9CLOT|nr:nucleoside recognition domain-containing protein [Thermobrachium celere]CDF58372.1 Nucleoside binding-domain containing protein YvoD [Thermobrachium celere DSM 8682]